MKRRFVKLATALVIAIVVNYLIAWAVLIPIKWAPMLGSFENTRSARWPEPVPTYWPDPDQVMTKRSLGVHIKDWIKFDHSRSSRYNIQSTYYHLTIFDSGWPLPCLRRAAWSHTLFDSTDTRPAQVKHFREDLPKDSWWNWGAPIPAALDHVEPGWKRLPIRPIPLHFLANTGFWMLVIMAPFALSNFVRRRNRKRTGRCIPCGYNRAGLAHKVPCPECGHSGIAARSTTAPQPSTT